MIRSGATIAYEDHTGDTAAWRVDRERALAKARAKVLADLPNGPMVPAGPVRTHLQLLQWRGVKMADVAREAGMYRSSLIYIRKNARHVHEETADAIFSVRIPHPESALKEAS